LTENQETEVVKFFYLFWRSTIYNLLKSNILEIRVNLMASGIVPFDAEPHFTKDNRSASKRARNVATCNAK
jgi:hypothetical protein